MDSQQVWNSGGRTRAVVRMGVVGGCEEGGPGATLP